MPLSRFEKMDEQKKAQILEAAAKEIAAHGYEKSAMNRILERAGISKGVAYYYFEDKADLVATVVRHYWMDFLSDFELVESDFTADNFWQKFSEHHFHCIDQIQAQPWIWGLNKAVMELPAEVRNSGPLGEVFADAFAWFGQIIAIGRRLGAIRIDLPDEFILNMGLKLDQAYSEWLKDRWEDMEPEELDAFVRAYVDMLRKAFS